jgi:hypothetical protein
MPDLMIKVKPDLSEVKILVEEIKVLRRALEQIKHDARKARKIAENALDRSTNRIKSLSLYGS